MVVCKSWYYWTKVECSNLMVQGNIERFVWLNCIFYIGISYSENSFPTVVFEISETRPICKKNRNFHQLSTHARLISRTDRKKTLIIAVRRGHRRKLINFTPPSLDSHKRFSRKSTVSVEKVRKAFTVGNYAAFFFSHLFSIHSFFLRRTTSAGSPRIFPYPLSAADSLIRYQRRDVKAGKDIPKLDSYRK